jgi:long-chain fatty acid transport protein
MQHIFKKTLLVSALAMAIAPAAYATNGLAPIGVGQAQKAMGGTGVGNPQNTMSIATNPASTSFISDGYDVELELFQPDRLTTRKALPPPPAGPGTPSVDYDGNEKPLFIVPGGGYKRTINNKYSVGLAVYGNGGMNTEYKGGPTFVHPLAGVTPLSGASGDNTGINLEQLFIAPTLGIKLNNKHSVGISANLVYQRFEAKGIQAIAGDPRANPTDLQAFSNPGVSSATGIGATIGWMGKLSDGFTVGASYRMKTKMGKFKKYSGLFADKGGMDVPAALTIGFSKKVTPRTQVAVDFQKIFYSDVGSIGNSGSLPTALGSNGGPGFGWSDQTVIKLGVKHQVNPKLALMGGFNYADSPVGPEDTFFGSLAPAVVEQHVSLGMEYKLNKRASIIGQYRHAFSNTVKGDLTQRQPYDLTMSQDALGIGYSVKF